MFICYLQETADEGQGAGEGDRDSALTHVNQAPPSSPGPAAKREDRTVKDLMLEVIEMQLKKDQGCLTNSIIHTVIFFQL